MVLLCLARLAIALVPLRLWRDGLGYRPATARPVDPDRARLLAAHVERAARRLPFETKCLARAVALSWAMRARGIAHELVIAVRPQAARHGTDDLHAWIEADAATVLGDLPGPWHELMRLPVAPVHNSC
jgi:hypothetical protein